MIATPGLSINFLKKENYTGSHAGSRYYLSGADDKIKVCIYPEPWCFEATPDDDKTWNEFPFSPEGLEDALEWIDSSVSKIKKA